MKQDEIIEFSRQADCRFYSIVFYSVLYTFHSPLIAIKIKENSTKRLFFVLVARPSPNKFALPKARQPPSSDTDNGGAIAPDTSHLIRVPAPGPLSAQLFSRNADTMARAGPRSQPDDSAPPPPPSSSVLDKGQGAPVSGQGPVLAGKEWVAPRYAGLLARWGPECGVSGAARVERGAS